MIHHQPLCNDDLLRKMLRSDTDSQCDSLLLEHVETCSRCQQRLDDLAADGFEWTRAIDVLSSNARAATGELDDRSLVGMEIRPVAWTESMAKELLSPPKHPEMLGRIGRYEVERLIGSGGMGVVFRAHDTELNRPVAIKLLAPYLASSGSARRRFAREARAAAGVVDDHVVPIHNVESENEPPFLVMQYVSGGSLQEKLDQRGPLDVAEVVRVGLQVAKGLAAAHAQGLIHRDVKPSNILLDEGVERAMLTDFGLARAESDASLTRSGFQPGTPHYMSPEQVRGEAIDGRSDLFGLGCVLYAACTGHPPFRAESSYAVLRRVTDESPRSLREINANVPEWLEVIVMKLLNKRRDDRFDSAAEVAELLVACLAHVQEPASTPLPVVAGELVKSLDSEVRGRLELSTTFPTGQKPPIGKLLTAAALAIPLLLAGIFIALETSKGTISIESEADDVPIVIKKGGTVYDRITVSRDGESIRVYAGVYEVLFDGKSEHISIDNETITLGRREEATVQIRLRQLPISENEFASDSKTPVHLSRGDSEQPVFDGHTIQWWLDEYRQTVRESKLSIRAATARMAIERLGRLPACDKAIQNAMRAWRGSLVNELSIAEHTLVAEEIVAVSGQRNRRIALEHVYHIWSAMIELSSAESDFQKPDSASLFMNLSEALASIQIPKSGIPMSLVEDIHEAHSAKRLTALQFLLPLFADLEEGDAAAGQYDLSEILPAGDRTALFDALLAASNDASAEVRSMSLLFLALVDPTNPRCVRKMEAFLETGTPAEQSQALEYFEECGDNLGLDQDMVSSAIMRWAKSSDPEQIYHAILFLEQSHDNVIRQQSLEDLIKLLQDQDWALSEEHQFPVGGTVKTGPLRKMAILALGNYWQRGMKGLAVLESEIERNHPATIKEALQARDAIAGYSSDLPLSDLQGSWLLQQIEDAPDAGDLLSLQSHLSKGQRVILTIDGCDLQYRGDVIAHLSQLRKHPDSRHVEIQLAPHGQRLHCDGMFDLDGNELSLSVSTGWYEDDQSKSKRHRYLLTKLKELWLEPNRPFFSGEANWLANLQGDWNVVMQHVADDGKRIEETYPAFIRGNRVGVRDAEGTDSQMFDFVIGAIGPPQQIDVKPVSRDPERIEALRDDADGWDKDSGIPVPDDVLNPIVQGIAEKLPDGFRYCGGISPTDPRPIRFASGPQSVLWTFTRPLPGPPPISIKRPATEASGDFLSLGLPGDTEVHVVGCYGPRNHQPIEVFVKSTGKPMVVVMCCYDIASWNLNVDPEADVRGVILSGYNTQQFSHNAPGKSVPTLVSTYFPQWEDITAYEEEELSRNYFYCDSPLEEEDFQKTQERVAEITGRTLTSFQAMARPQKFIVDGKRGIEELAIAKRWLAFVPGADKQSEEFIVMDYRLDQFLVDEEPTPAKQLAERMDAFNIPRLGQASVAPTESKTPATAPRSLRHLLRLNDDVRVTLNDKWMGRYLRVLHGQRTLPAEQFAAEGSAAGDSIEIPAKITERLSGNRFRLQHFSDQTIKGKPEHLVSVESVVEYDDFKFENHGADQTIHITLDNYAIRAAIRTNGRGSSEHFEFGSGSTHSKLDNMELVQLLSGAESIWNDVLQQLNATEQPVAGQRIQLNVEVTNRTATGSSSWSDDLSNPEITAAGSMDDLLQDILPRQINRVVLARLNSGRNTKLDEVMAALQGTWDCTSVQVGDVKTGRLNVVGSQFTLIEDDLDEEKIYSFSLKEQPSSSTRSIDLILKTTPNKTIKGLVEQRNNQFRLCFRPAADDRPADFKLDEQKVILNLFRSPLIWGTNRERKAGMEEFVIVSRRLAAELHLTDDQVEATDLLLTNLWEAYREAEAMHTKYSRKADGTLVADIQSPLDSAFRIQFRNAFRTELAKIVSGSKREMLLSAILNVRSSKDPNEVFQESRDAYPSLFGWPENHYPVRIEFRARGSKMHWYVKPGKHGVTGRGDLLPPELEHYLVQGQAVVDDAKEQPRDAPAP